MTNTNLVATILFATNSVTSLHPSGDEKVRTETVVALVTVPGWTTNVVKISTNTTRWVWCEEPLKPERRPLDVKDLPPMPPKVIK